MQNQDVFPDTVPQSRAHTLMSCSVRLEKDIMIFAVSVRPLDTMQASDHHLLQATE